MAALKKIEPRTVKFIEEYERLTSENKMPTNVALAGILGVKSKSTISEILAKRQNIQPEAWNRFVAFFKLDLPTESSEISGTAQEPLSHYVEKRRDLKNGDSHKGVPVYFGNTRAGNIEVYSDDPAMQTPVGFLDPILFPGCNHAEKVSGDSMHPMIRNQAVVAGKVINKKGIIPGEKYGIHTKYGMNTVKFIQESEKGPEYLKLISYNESVKPFDIKFDEVSFIFWIKYIINPS